MSDNLAIPSLVGRLLAEVSWDGKLVTRYRMGDQGYENVLTAECLRALGFLPRRHFLGAALQEVVGATGEVKTVVASGVEEATIDLLPGNLLPQAKRWLTPVQHRSSA